MILLMASKKANNFWGIGDVRRIAATGLDIVGADVEAILREAERG